MNLKMNNILPTFLLAMLVLGSCLKGQKNKDYLENQEELKKENLIVLDTFAKFPPEIEGCACYFSNNEREFNRSLYIYADDYEKTAFISIDGELKKFTLSKSENINNRIEKSFVNDNYELTLIIESSKQLDETIKYTGTLSIKGKNGNIQLKKIYGECGC